MIGLWTQGGWVLAVIAAASLLGWTLIVDKWFALRRERAGGNDWADRAVARLKSGDRAGALALCEGHDNALARLLHAAMLGYEPQRRFFERRIQPLLHSEAATLHQRLPAVAAIAGVTPLLGLLGTVVGMIDTFEVLTVHGLAISRMASGIGTALVTTQAGLIVALPLLVLHRYLKARIHERIDTLTLYVKKVETLRCAD